jgi:hypothetical protein
MLFLIKWYLLKYKCQQLVLYFIKMIVNLLIQKTCVIIFVFTGWWWCCQHMEFAENVVQLLYIFCEGVWRWDPSYNDAYCWGDL